MRTMYDSVSPFKIPNTAEMVAGYMNGAYKWSKAGWDRFPTAVKIGITIYIPKHSVPNVGDVLDVEANDVNVTSVAAARIWCKMRVESGVRPTIYTSRSTWPFFHPIDADFWIADVTPNPHLLPGSVATQWKWTPSYDESLVSDSWHPVSIPSPIPPPHTGDKYMIVPMTHPGTDGDGNGYLDVPNTNAALVVTVVTNCQEPSANGYPLYPTFKGACQYGTAARCVFEGGAANMSPFAVRVVVSS